MSDSATATCRLLEWDTGFFGFRIGRVEQTRLTETDLERILSWSERERITCLYFEAAADDPVTIQLAERAGFHLVDVRMELELCPLHVRPELEETASLSCRAAINTDVPRLQEIARTAFTDTRYYFDERFPRERCAALYSTWVERSCCGDLATSVRVAEESGQPIGFLTCQMDAHAGGRIGLFGIEASAIGRGIGSALLADSLRWFATQETERVATTTQGRNTRAQRLYQRAGFTTARVSLFYHLWRDRVWGVGSAGVRRSGWCH